MIFLILEFDIENEAIESALSSLLGDNRFKMVVDSDRVEELLRDNKIDTASHCVLINESIEKELTAVGAVNFVIGQLCGTSKKQDSSSKNASPKSAVAMIKRMIGSPPILMQLFEKYLTFLRSQTQKIHLWVERLGEQMPQFGCNTFTDLDTISYNVAARARRNFVALTLLKRPMIPPRFIWVNRHRRTLPFWDMQIS